MSSTTSAPASAPLNGGRSTRSGASAVTAAPARLPNGRPKTPPAMLALCLLLMLGCGAAAGALVLASESSVTVVAAARALPAGTVIGPEDLRSAELSGSGLAAIPGDRAGTLLGKTVLGPVPEGTLINAGMVASEPAPAEGRIAVGLALEASKLPAAELAAGREVSIYRLPGTGDPLPGEADSAGAAAARTSEPSTSPLGAGQVLVQVAKVLSVTPGTNGGFLVTVEVGSGPAPDVSAASALGRVAVGLLPLGGGS